MLMASHMYAYILKDRHFDLLNVHDLEGPEMAETAIENLVINETNKGLIKAIAQIYTDSGQSNRFSADFIHGKGEGQIILLHGPPGTGKTLTAESVAEFARRPLLSVTAADLGHENETLERRLLRYFRRASEWDAIVLLNEADVYLEQRTTQDLKRNSIVSVFLRALGYFQDILFLTTNWVGHFDEAFMSRIHVSLGYEKLDNVAREQIWNNLFKKLKDDHKHGGLDIRHEYDAKGYVRSEDVQSLQWNGREIRSAFQTAVALAVCDWKHKKNDPVPELKEADLKQVVSMSSAFRNYMKAAHSGMDDSTWAFKYGNREDKFPSTPGKQT
ncbi:P-loop containing nucleoside triphosphate hydrolase protein [Ophiobolus disseminans]|uniref:P-loop containing nucleoside triphosphate hydrolase protein n=1 Tax=Ophiobolus disseminans TaxID=1469910 RepID=A0A6A6ZTS4_9PLEO|nr:P-loop containing nucleoside triphosphate hydrolase protein [Ophiobolus disseminans]